MPRKKPILNSKNSKSEDNKKESDKKSNEKKKLSSEQVKRKLYEAQFKRWMKENPTKAKVLAKGLEMNQKQINRDEQYKNHLLFTFSEEAIFYFIFRIAAEHILPKVLSGPILPFKLAVDIFSGKIQEPKDLLKSCKEFSQMTVVTPEDKMRSDIAKKCLGIQTPGQSHGSENKQHDMAASEELAASKAASSRAAAMKAGSKK